MYNNIQTTTPTEAAKAEVTRLFQIERDLTAKRRGKLASIETTRQNAAQAILDDGASIEVAAADTLRGQAEVRTIEEAIALARQRRLVAIKNRFAVEASELRAAAQLKGEEAAVILRKCDPLLRKLSDLQGITYDVSVLLAQRNGPWSGSVITGRPLIECNPLEGQRDIGAGFLIPRSRELLNQAEALEQRARVLDERDVHVDYRIEKATVEELLSDEVFVDPEILAPAVHTVEDWAAEVEKRVRRDRPELLSGSLNGGGRCRRYKLAWRAGEIDPDYSSISFPGVSFSGGDPTFTMREAA